MTERSDIEYNETITSMTTSKKERQEEQDLGLASHDPFKSKPKEQIDLE